MTTAPPAAEELMPDLVGPGERDEKEFTQSPVGSAPRLGQSAWSFRTWRLNAMQLRHDHRSLGADR